MKKIILTLLIILLTFYSVFADIKLDFSSDKKEYNIDERINLKINLSTDEKWISELNIKWLDNFQIIWKNQIQSSSYINWKKSINFSLNLSLLAIKSWDFILWPVTTKYWTWTIISNNIWIKITWERVMINNTIRNNEEEEDEKNNNLDNLDNLSLWWESKEFKKKKIIGLDWKEMTDIYPEKKFLNWYLFHKDSIYIILLFVLILLILFLLNKYTIYFLNKKDKIIEKYKRKKYIIKKKINYNKLLISLEEEYIDSKKEVFYAKLWNLFRIYLDDKVSEWLSKKSLSEFKNEKITWLLDDKKDIFIKTYEKIYYPEYNIIWDNIEIRRKIIKEVKNLIIN